MGTPDLKALAERPARYWNEDGLPELVMGALWIFYAGLYLAGMGLRPGLIRTAFWIVMSPFLPAGMFFVAIWGIKRIKERVTYPRTGYVNSLIPRSAWAVGIVVSVLALAGIIILVFAGIGVRMMNLLPSVCSFLLAALFAFLAIRQKTSHLLILSVAATVSAIGIPLLHFGEDGILWIWLWLWLGTVSAVTGALRLRSFLRGHPRNQEREV
jgi:hypothetical protein